MKDGHLIAVVFVEHQCIVASLPQMMYTALTYLERNGDALLLHCGPSGRRPKPQTHTLAGTCRAFIVGKVFDRDRLEIQHDQVRRWTDLYASRDPVSEGPLPVGGPLCFSREIINRRSLLLDHISYWRNVEAFRSAVALELASMAGWYSGPEHPKEVKAAERSRDGGVKLLVSAYALLAVATVAASAFFGRPVGEWIAQLAGGISRDAEAFMLAGSRPQLSAAIAFVAAAIAFAPLVSKLWGAWSRQRTTRWLEGLGLQ